VAFEYRYLCNNHKLITPLFSSCAWQAFADAFAVLENELPQFTAESDMSASSFSLLKKIIPSIDSNEL
jgi:hypothetical protein